MALEYNASFYTAAIFFSEYGMQANYACIEVKFKIIEGYECPFGCPRILLNFGGGRFFLPCE